MGVLGNSNGVYLVTVQPKDIGRCWAVVGPLLARALKYSDEITLEQVRGRLERGEYQLWTAVSERGVEGAWCTRLAEYPAFRVCEVVLCGGDDLDRWLDITVAPIAEWAKSAGCRRLRILGRKGWQRKLPEFREVYRVIEREI